MQTAANKKVTLVELGRSLLEASKQGQEDVVRYLLASGAPFTTDWLGTSPLHMACKNGHVGTAEVLMRAGVSRDARTKVDQTPLHVSCQAGHAHVVEMLLKNGAAVTAIDMLKMTPLHWAVERNHPEVVKLLMERGANPRQLNKFSKTPLEIALDKNNDLLLSILQDDQYVVKDVPEEAIPPPVKIVRLSSQTKASKASISSHLPESSSKISIQTAGDLGFSGLPPVDSITVRKDVFTQHCSSSTSVLATLAALAEVSAPLKSPTIPWMDPKGGQTIVLTEAGKLALANLSKPSAQANTRKRPRKRTPSQVAAPTVQVIDVPEVVNLNPSDEVHHIIDQTEPHTEEITTSVVPMLSSAITGDDGNLITLGEDAEVTEVTVIAMTDADQGHGLEVVEASDTLQKHLQEVQESGQDKGHIEEFIIKIDESNTASVTEGD